MCLPHPGKASYAVRAPILMSTWTIGTNLWRQTYYQRRPSTVSSQGKRTLGIQKGTNSLAKFGFRNMVHYMTSTSKLISCCCPTSLRTSSTPSFSATQPFTLHTTTRDLGCHGMLCSKRYIGVDFVCLTNVDIHLFVEKSLWRHCHCEKEDWEG